MSGAIGVDKGRGAALLWDTSTLRKGLQREIFASLVETTGSRILVVEQTARELARLVDPRRPAEGLKTLYAGHEDPTPIQHLLIYRTDPHTTIRHQIWWAEEFARPDGIYHAVLLDEAATSRYDDLMDSFCTARALPGLSEDEVREHPDAITICQAAAINGKVIVSPDQDFYADRLAANAWAVARHRAGELTQPMIVTRPERELEDWCAEEPQEVLKAVIGAAWPDDTQATRTTIHERLHTQLKNMSKVDYLAPTAAFCKQLFNTHDEPSHLIEDVRAHLPTRTRAADARHPANPMNRGRNWAKADDSVRNAIELPRWRLYVNRQVFRIEENKLGSNYTVVDEIPVYERARIIEKLVELNIEVEGTPRHGGSQGGTRAGFGQAMNILIDEEVARTQTIGLE